MATCGRRACCFFASLAVGYEVFSLGFLASQIAVFSLFRRENLFGRTHFPRVVCGLRMLALVFAFLPCRRWFFFAGGLPGGFSVGACLPYDCCCGLAELLFGAFS